MKKLLYTLTFLLAVISFSCEEDFSPKDTFKEQYVMYGGIGLFSILQGGAVYLKLLKTYDAEGLNPYETNTFYQMTNADVKLKIGRFVYKMEEHIQKRKVRNDTLQIFYEYYSQSIIPKQELSVTVTLPDSTVLTASTIIPAYPACTFSYNPEYFNTEEARLRNGNTWVISWETDGFNLFIPSAYIFYDKWTKGEDEQWSWKDSMIYIPLRYVNNQPVYPKEMWDSKLEFPFDTIDSTMAQISAGDPIKSNYRINLITLDIKAYDINYSKYYSSTNGYLDEYSIKLDESIYSSVSGGLGVFGSSSDNYYRFNVDTTYAAKFGYKVK